MKPAALARLLLLGTVLVWGATFVLVKRALADASPLAFNCMRMALAAGVLLVVNWRQVRRVSWTQVRGGAVAGLFLAAGYQFQTLGLARTTAARSALLTGLVVVLVPGMAMLPGLGRRRPGRPAAVGAGLAFAGLLLLTTPAGLPARAMFGAIGAGDLLTLGCAVAFAAHLLTLARISRSMDAGLLAAIQISTAAAVMLAMLPLEPVRFLLTPRLAIALAVTSLLATAAAFTIQSYAQQHLPPTQTAVLLTLEPVFAAATSWLVLGERLGLRSLTGAGLILGAIALIELAPGSTHSTEIPA